MADEKTYQMLWDCPHCGTQGLLGLDHKHCPACGGAQDPTWRYFPPDDQKVAVQDHTFYGRDKVCPACDAPCSAIADFCGNCGSPMDGAKVVRTREEQAAADGQAFADDSAKAARDEHKAARRAEAEAQAAPKDGGSSAGATAAKAAGGMALLGTLAAGFVALVMVLLCAGFFLWKSEENLTVTGHQWERSIVVEQLKPTTESAWRDQVPKNATIDRCNDEKRGSKKVQDGETCETKRRDNGDGTFSEKRECKPKYKEEPTYDKKCTYKVNKWVAARTEKAGGGLKDAPKWPPVRLAKTGQCVGCEREGKRAEAFTLTFKDSAGKAKSCTTSEARWKGAAVGSVWAVPVGKMSGALDCAGMKPAK